MREDRQQDDIPVCEADRIALAQAYLDTVGRGGLVDSAEVYSVRKRLGSPPVEIELVASTMVGGETSALSRVFWRTNFAMLEGIAPGISRRTRERTQGVLEAIEKVDAFFK